MRNLILLLLSLVTFSSNAATFKYGAVSKEEVEQNQHSIEPDAKAAVLYQEGKTKVTYNQSQSRFEVITEVYKRIKIYDEARADLGNFQIPYYSVSWNDEKISGIKGTVFSLENGKVVKSSLKKEHIFDEKTSKYKRQKKIAMPNVRKGSVIELKYKKVSPYSALIPKWYFQYDIPCDKSIYSVETPEWFTYNTSSKGSLMMENNTRSQSRSITFSSTYDASNNPLVVDKRRTYDRINYNANISTYSMDYIPSLKDEDFVPCMNNYRSSLSYELLRSRMPGGTVKNYTESWKSISRMLYEDSDLGDQINKKLKEHKTILENTSGLSSDQKAEFLYNYVKDNFAWNGYYGKYADEGVKNLLKSKSGNVGDINLLLANLFQRAGLAPVVVTSRAREHGFINLYYPSQLDLNYVLVQYRKEDGNAILLDATDPAVNFGYLPERALNMKGITITANGGSEIRIENPNNGKERNIIKASFNEDLELELNCTSKVSGYISVNKNNELSEYANNEAIMDDLESRYEGRAYESFSYAKNKDKKNLISINEKFILENASESIDGKIYIDALLGIYGEDHPFTEEERTLPIFRDFTKESKITIQIEIPEGYALESHPESMIITLPEDMGNFMYTVVSAGNKIIINVLEKETKDVLNPIQYDAVKKYYDMIASKAEEKIVLAKI